MHVRQFLLIVTIAAGACREQDAADACVSELHDAISANQVDRIKTLLQEQAGSEALEAQDDKKRTPLQLAADVGHAEAIKVMLEAGAAIEVQDAKERTPLHRAALEGHTEAIKALLEGGAAIEAQTNMKWTPLHVAASKGYTEAIEVLLERGAAIEALADQQWTPLHVAAAHGRTESIKALLEGGASAEARSFSRQARSQKIQQLTPLHLAAEQGHEESMVVLKDAARVSKAKALHAFGLSSGLGPLFTELDDIDDTLAAAAAWFDRMGVKHARDVEIEWIDDFTAALGLELVPARKLAQALHDRHMADKDEV